MLTLDDPDDFRLDYIFLRFTKLKKPVMVPWIEVFKGRYSAEKSTPELVAYFVEFDDGVGLKSMEKVDMLTLLQKKLNSMSIYGDLLDFQIQPAGRPLTPEAHKFVTTPTF